MKLFLYLIFSLFVFSCSKTLNNEIITLDFEKDLIPEGIAVDSKFKTVFINSLRKNKIVKCNLDGSNPQDFIVSNQYGYLSGFGMTIEEDTLYALGNDLQQESHQSILLLINLKTGNLINSFPLNNSKKTYLNDLAISSTNNIYITDSESNKIYSLKNTKDSLNIFFESDEIAYPNGIAISPDNKHLYIASFMNGIRVVDINTKKVLGEPNPESAGIDGLKYYNNSLIGIINSRQTNSNNGLFRFYLNDAGTEIIKRKLLVPYGEHFKFPTTLDIADGYLYYIINSQLDNLNQQTNEMYDLNKLEPYTLMKKKIS